MSLYEPPDRYVDRQLAGLEGTERATRRLAIDLAAILTGPTCGAEADRYATKLTEDGGEELARRMREAADRYFKATGKL